MFIRSRATIVLITLALVMAACGGSGSSTEAGSTSVADSTSTTEEPTSTTGAASATSEPVVQTVEVEVESETTAAPAETTAAPAETTTTAPATTTTTADPGSPLDFGPQLGTGLAVVGVRYDDVLNFRAGPGVHEPIVTTGAALAVDRDIAAAGEAWQFPGSIWLKVIIDGGEAWAHQSFLGSLGATDSVFDEVAEELGVLTAVDVETMALKVVETRAGDGPDPRVRFVGEPLAFDDATGFAVVDMLDIGDDALKGERLRIEVQLAFDDDGETVAFVVLTEVERTLICGRGVTEGLCL